MGPNPTPIPANFLESPAPPTQTGATTPRSIRLTVEGEVPKMSGTVFRRRRTPVLTARRRVLARAVLAVAPLLSLSRCSLPGSSATARDRRRLYFRDERFRADADCLAVRRARRRSGEHELRAVTARSSHEAHGVDEVLVVLRANFVRSALAALVRLEVAEAVERVVVPKLPLVWYTATAGIDPG